MSLEYGYLGRRGVEPGALVGRFVLSVWWLKVRCESSGDRQRWSVAARGGKAARAVLTVASAWTLPSSMQKVPRTGLINGALKGHDFSRAAKCQQRPGLQPLRDALFRSVRIYETASSRVLGKAVLQSKSTTLHEYDRDQSNGHQC